MRTTQKMRRFFYCLLSVYLTYIPLIAQNTTKTSEWEKMRYNIQTDIVTSTGKHAPFWIVSNRHGLSSLENHNANLSVGLFRDFDHKKGFTWAYGAELAGAYNYSAPFYIQQLYADVKYNCWELSIGSKERWSEGKHRTLSGGGLTFAPNARPIPQIRFGINEYTTAPWLFNEWIQVKGHFSYGKYSDKSFQIFHLTDAPDGTHYTYDILFHEKTAFLKLGNEAKGPFSVEIGLEMYTQFGGTFMIRRQEQGDSVRYELPHTHREYLKALFPQQGGSDAPASDQKNVNGNVFGSWHLAANYQFKDWRIRLYYEHFYEDHSGLLGYHKFGEGEVVSYFPWYDGLYAFEITLPKNRVINTVVYEFITSRTQGGPIVKYGNDPIVGKDNYYNNSIYQSWRHWGMSVCNPHHLSPVYSDIPTQNMLYTRIRSHHIGFNGSPTEQLGYRFLGSWTTHWGSWDDPLPAPLTQLSLMGELSYSPSQWEGWQFTGTFALDRSQLIGNNIGFMLTLRKQGFFKQ